MSSRSERRGTKPITPVPLFKIMLLGLILLANNNSIWMIFSFLPFMVAHFFPELSTAELGFEAGILGSAFSCGSLLGNLLSGYLSDRVGRRPTLMWGLMGTAISCTCFGFSPTFWFAVFSRFMWGVLNGNIGVAKTYLAEISDDTNMAQGMAYFGVVGGAGRMVGPMIGGLLSMPAKSYPIFRGTIFDTFPFALPSMVITVYCLVILLVTYIWLPETLPMKKRRSLTGGSDSSSHRSGGGGRFSSGNNTTKYSVLNDDDEADEEEHSTVGGVDHEEDIEAVDKDTSTGTAKGKQQKQFTEKGEVEMVAVRRIKQAGVFHGYDEEKGPTTGGNLVLNNSDNDDYNGAQKGDSKSCSDAFSDKEDDASSSSNVHRRSIVDEQDVCYSPPDQTVAAGGERANPSSAIPALHPSTLSTNTSTTPFKKRLSFSNLVTVKQIGSSDLEFTPLKQVHKTDIPITSAPVASPLHSTMKRDVDSTFNKTSSSGSYTNGLQRNSNSNDQRDSISTQNTTITSTSTPNDCSNNNNDTNSGEFHGSPDSSSEERQQQRLKLLAPESPPQDDDDYCHHHIEDPYSLAAAPSPTSPTSAREFRPPPSQMVPTHAYNQVPLLHVMYSSNSSSSSSNNNSKNSNNSDDTTNHLNSATSYDQQFHPQIYVADGMTPAEMTLRYSNGSEFFESMENTQSQSVASNLAYILKQKNIFVTTALYGLNAFVVIIVSEVIPLWVVNDEQDGGLEYNARIIGFTTMTVGVCSTCLQLTLYPYLVGQLGALRMHRLGTLLLALSIFLLPMVTLSNSLDCWDCTWVLIVACILFETVAATWSLISVFVLISNSCYSHQRATVNGIGQTFASIGRLSGPYLGSYLFAWSNTNGLDWPLNYYLVFYVLCAICIANYNYTLSLPRSIQRRRREPKFRNWDDAYEAYLLDRRQAEESEAMSAVEEGRTRSHRHRHDESRDQSRDQSHSHGHGGEQNGTQTTDRSSSSSSSRDGRITAAGASAYHATENNDNWNDRISSSNSINSKMKIGGTAPAGSNDSSARSGNLTSIGIGINAASGGTNGSNSVLGSVSSAISGSSSSSSSNADYKPLLQQDNEDEEEEDACINTTSGGDNHTVKYSSTSK